MNASTPSPTGPKSDHEADPKLDPKPGLKPDPTPARLGLLYAVVFVEIGIAMPFMPLWLATLGLDAAVIGLLLALPIAMRIVATAPLLALIDRGLPAERLVALGSLAVGLTYALMPVAAGFGWPALALLVLVNAVAGAPLVPCIDYMTLAATRRIPGLDYARIRMAGSVAFLGANLAGGVLLGKAGAGSIPFLLAGLAALAALVAAANLRGKREAPRRPPPGPGPALPRGLVLTIAAAALIQSSHAAVYGFGSIAWSERGVATGAIGMLWSVGVASEIVLFWTVGRWPGRRPTPFALLAVGGTAAVVRAAGSAFAGDTLVVLVALQALHGLTFGATQLGAMAAVSALAPEGSRGRAQGTLSAATALASTSSTLLCGFAYRAYGGSGAFLLMVPLALAGLCLAARAARGWGTGSRSVR